MQSIEIYFSLGSLPSHPVSTIFTSTLTRYRTKSRHERSKRVARGTEKIHLESINTQQLRVCYDHTTGVLHETIDAAGAAWQRPHAKNTIIRPCKDKRHEKVMLVSFKKGPFLRCRCPALRWPPHLQLQLYSFCSRTLEKPSCKPTLFWRKWWFALRSNS